MAIRYLEQLQLRGKAATNSGQPKVTNGDAKIVYCCSSIGYIVQS
ncbi:hypothetical protein QT979_17100 [Microcoleus sp. w2-18bC1]